MFRNILLLFVVTATGADDIRKPLYQYRYQTEDVMKSDATSIPVRGYHVVEGGYYPEQFGEYSGGFGGAGKFGGGSGFIGGGSGFIGGGSGFAGGGHYIDSPGTLGEFGGRFYPSGGNKFIGGGYGSGGFIGSGISPSHYHHHGIGGEYLDKQFYNSGNKKINDEGFEKVNGRKGEEVSHGQEGYNQGKVALKNNKGDSGYYSQEEGGKKASEDGKAYQGGQHYNQEGKNGEEKKQKGFHKKGHVIKGFKSSHHKDEDGKTEEFYDEQHDEGDSNSFGGKSGSYGENVQSSYKGGHDNGQFNAGQNKKEGHYGSHHVVDNSNADQGQYGQKKYSGSGEVYGSQNGIDQHSLLGHQEANKIFKHRPYHVPFFPVY